MVRALFPTDWQFIMQAEIHRSLATLEDEDAEGRFPA
jgi:hypothetical protein